MRIGRRTFIAAAVTALTTAVGAAGSRQTVSRFRTRPKVVCELPDRDYVHGGPSQPALAVSMTAQLLRVPDVPANTLPSGHQMYYYQLKQNEVRVDHCSISRVALAIRDDGYWTLSLRADQNLGTAAEGPLVAVGRPTPPQTTTIPQVHHILPGSSPTTKFTAHIKRNLFIVRIRGYPAFRTEAADAGGPPGRPALFELTPDPFWVQREVPYFPRFQGAEADIAEFYKTIDRVEVELSYR